MKTRVKSTLDTRYINTQKRFDRVIERFIKQGIIHRLQVLKVSKKANVATSTFYDHYYDMEEALEYSNTRQGKDLKILRDEIEKTASLDLVYMKILYFIHKNREYYELAVQRKNGIPLTQIVEIFRPVLCRGWSKYDAKTNHYIFAIFSWEIAGVIYFWGKEEKFSDKKIPALAKKLTYLTESACQRLA